MSRKAQVSAGAGTRRRPGHGLFRFILTLFMLAMLAVSAWAYIDNYQFSMLVVSVDLDQTQASLFETETSQLNVSVRSFGLSETLGLSEPVIIWSSDNEAVASVDEAGSVTALAPGKAVITACESKSGMKSTCSVAVYSLTDIVLNSERCELGAGETFELTAAVSSNEFAEPFEYAVSDPQIAEVSEDGIITAVSDGDAVITVSARGYTSAECALTVHPAPSSLVIADNGGICAGETRSLNLQMGADEYCSRFVCSSSDTGIIAIDGTTIKAVGRGTATVTAKTYNGLVCQQEYTVSSEPQYVKLGRSKLNMYSGPDFSFRLTPMDSTGCCGEYYYTTSDPSIVTVEPDGTLTGHNRGRASVTCSTYNGKTNTLDVNVTIVEYTVPYTSARVAHDIEALASTYPDLIQTEVIGQSVEGKDITLVKLGKGPRKALVVAGLHSRENIGVTFTMRCIEEYADAYSTHNGYYGTYNLRKLLDEYTLYFVPLMNPDGLDIAVAGAQPVYTDEEINYPKFKNNSNGVNLNRNFPLLWGYSGPEGSVNATEPDTDSYAGASEASEPETQAIVSLCRANEFEWLLDMHCRGNLIYYQDKVSPVNDADNHLASRLSRRCGYTLTDQSNAYEISGGLENWFRSEFGKPGICIELVLSEYAYVVNSKFEAKLDWEHTRYSFLVGLE